MVRAALAIALASVAAFPLGAADDKAAPTGTWSKEADGTEIQFAFKKDACTITVTAGDNGATIACKCSHKDGEVKLTVTEVTEKGNFPAKPKEGTEFGFKWKADGDKATLSDLTGPGADDAKGAVEGEYSKKK